MPPPLPAPTPGATPWGHVLAGAAPVLMGIVNVTPDSFSDGGAYAAAADAVAQAHRLAAAGAALIDIGGESTRPGFVPVPVEEELARVVPVLDALRGRLDALVSIDTTKPAVARAALARGVTIVNDIWGLQGDPGMAQVVAEGGAAIVMMHNRTSVDPAVRIGDDILAFFERSLAIAAGAGIPIGHVVLDPGIGFGKTPAQQIEAIRHLPVLQARFGLPILVGLSRKSVLAGLTGLAGANRLAPTIAAHLAAWSRGARIFRVHDVAEHAAAFAVYDRLRADDDR